MALCRAPKPQQRLFGRRCTQLAQAALTCHLEVHVTQLVLNALRVRGVGEELEPAGGTTQQEALVSRVTACKLPMHKPLPHSPRYRNSVPRPPTCRSVSNS